VQQKDWADFLSNRWRSDDSTRTPRTQRIAPLGSQPEYSTSFAPTEPLLLNLSDLDETLLRALITTLKSIKEDNLYVTIEEWDDYKSFYIRNAREKDPVQINDNQGNYKYLSCVVYEEQQAILIAEHFNENCSLFLTGREAGLLPFMDEGLNVFTHAKPFPGAILVKRPNENPILLELNGTAQIKIEGLPAFNIKNDADDFFYSNCTFRVYVEEEVAQQLAGRGVVLCRDVHEGEPFVVVNMHLRQLICYPEGFLNGLSTIANEHGVIQNAVAISPQDIGRYVGLTFYPDRFCMNPVNAVIDLKTGA
jgi:hypothetical protein